MSNGDSGEFRLEALLRLAAQQEDQLALRVSNLELLHREEETRLERLRHHQVAALREGSLRRAPGPLDGTWLQQAETYDAALRQRIEEQERRVSDSRARLEVERAGLIEASQRRRMLEKLKEQQLQRWRAALERREVSEAAELSAQRFLARRSPAATNLEVGAL